ncbi:hypothetical protein NDU88_003511 [Pleurodeles waltl]|uniref:Uncharacterized protein n=1 Tax=Pleurodeles waltl TaxID=8319 RepID=A0AAV7MYQ6_PLEWA|nr:hypothetical protein NDU88_003511 [Pleurodeles waltl]
MVQEADMAHTAQDVPSLQMKTQDERRSQACIGGGTEGVNAHVCDKREPTNGRMLRSECCGMNVGEDSWAVEMETIGEEVAGPCAAGAIIP